MKHQGAIILLAVMSATQVSAQTANLKTMTCKQLLASDPQMIDRIATWLDGWYTEDKDPTVVNSAEIARASKEMRDYCAKNPGHTVLKAAEEVYED